MIEQVLTDPDTIIRLATQLKEERVKIKLLETTIEEQKPLVEFSETILKSKDNINMDNMAKLLKYEGLDIGRNRLFEFLRQQKVLNTNNIPYQDYMNKKWFTLTEKTNNTRCGIKLFTVVLVTSKGQVGITNLVRSKY
jgi:anti-repressor protein